MKDNPSGAFRALLDEYESALQRRQNEAESAPESVLGLLRTRDEIDRALERERTVGKENLDRLLALDRHLQEQAGALAQALDWPAYRHSLGVSPKSWWWHLDTLVESETPEKLVWLWQGARFGLWTINLGLLGTLAGRFFSGASGLMEVFTIALPSLLVLMQANNELTASGREGFNRLFNRLNIPPRWYEAARFVPTVVLFGGLLGIWFTQPQFSEEMNRQGSKAEERGQWARAERDFLKALALNGANLNAAYNLGNLYEELQNFDSAKKYYMIAAKGGVADAYNNLGRLYIRQNQYSEAILLLNDGLAIVENQERQTEDVDPELNKVKYSLLKNLGWAKLRQGESFSRANQLKPIDYTDAKFQLQVAIGIASDPELKSSILNPGAAHCLLAMVLEAEQSPESLDQWRQCYDLVGQRLGARDIRNPEEEAWFALAKQKLTLAGESLP
ncbi:MAG: tetratricopeptide repeat protein [Cyanobacteriota bacterium]|nr:tetratricopeptide repeat protein [Cyanobacteriota bacterium]